MFDRFDETDRPARPLSTHPLAGGPGFGPYRITAAALADDTAQRT
jgi:hypothetical protein